MDLQLESVFFVYRCLDLGAAPKVLQLLQCPKARQLWVLSTCELYTSRKGH